MLWFGIIMFVLGVIYGWIASNVWYKLFYAWIIGGIGWAIFVTSLGMSRPAAIFMALAWGFIFWFVDATVPTLVSSG